VLEYDLASIRPWVTLGRAGERGSSTKQKGFIMQMTPKRLRQIADVLQMAGYASDHETAQPMAEELRAHAEEIEDQQTIRIKEPGTVFGDLKAQAEKGR
jgi:hypothetical protein